MLCPSCRRQLDRGAGFCLGCGMPVAGQAAPLELVLGDRTRVPVVSEMTIGRAPARRSCSTTPRSRACTRASPATAAGRRRSRTRARATARGSTARGSRADRAARRGEAAPRRPGDARRAPARRRRGGAHDRRPRRAPASSSRHRRGRGHQPGDPVRDAPARALGLRAQAPRRLRGQQALGAARPGERDVPAPERQRRAAVRAVRRHADAHRPDRRGRAALRRRRLRAAGTTARGPGRARIPSRRREGDLGRWPGGAAEPAPAALHATDQDVPVSGRRLRAHLPRRRVGAVHPPGADRAWRC